MLPLGPGSWPVPEYGVQFPARLSSHCLNTSSNMKYFFSLFPAGFFLSFFFFFSLLYVTVSFLDKCSRFFLGFPPSVQPPASSKRHPLKTSNNENVSSLLESWKWLLFA